MIPPVVGIVGPCASGKSSLVSALGERGVKAKQIVQEHSYAPQMWRIIGRPDFLLYLDASFENCSRRKQLDWNQADYQQQQERLADARENCDYYLSTDELTQAQVVDRALNELERRGLLDQLSSNR